jgi:hypothetical protein
LPTLVAMDTSGNLVQGAQPNWTMVTPCGAGFGFPGPGPTTNVSGQATSPTLNVSMTTPGSCGVLGQIGGARPGSLYWNVYIVPVGNFVMWLGGTDSNWETAANWSTGSVPHLASDSVFVPGHSGTLATGFSRNPVLANGTNRSVGTLYVESGASVAVNSDTLTVNGSLPGGGRVTASSNGLLALAGTQSTALISGTFPRMRVGQSGCANGTIYSVVGQLRTEDTLTVNCQLNVGTGTIDTYNIGPADIQVLGSGGLLDLTSSSGSVLTRNILFNGADETGHLTAGTLTFYGSFTQSHANTNITRSFVASGTHKTIASGFSAQTITIADDSTSNFNYLTVSGPVSLAADATAAKAITISSNGSIGVNTHTLTAKDSLIVTGRLDMPVGASPSKVIVGGNVVFNGSTAQNLQAGEIDLAGNFAETASVGGVFAPAAGFLVKLNGIGNQTISFNNPTTSYFDKVEVANTSVSGVDFNSNMKFNGQMDIDANGRAMFGGSFFTFTFGNSAPLRIHANALLNVNGTITLGTSLCQRNGPSNPPTIGGFSGVSVSLLGTTANGGSCTETSVP